jgi:uncharacterized protein DUF6496
LRRSFVVDFRRAIFIGLSNRFSDQLRGMSVARIFRQITQSAVTEMPEEETLERAREDEAEGKSPSTQAGEFVREEIEHVREGKHGARSAKQAIAIGLSKARRAGVKLPPPDPAKTRASTRRTAISDSKKSRQPRKTSIEAFAGDNERAQERRTAGGVVQSALVAGEVERDETNDEAARRRCKESGQDARTFPIAFL